MQLYLLINPLVCSPPTHSHPSIHLSLSHLPSISIYLPITYPSVHLLPIHFLHPFIPHSSIYVSMFLSSLFNRGAPRMWGHCQVGLCTHTHTSECMGLVSVYGQLWGQVAPSTPDQSHFPHTWQATSGRGQRPRLGEPALGPGSPPKPQWRVN